MKALVATGVAVLLAGFAAGQKPTDPASCPLHEQHMKAKQDPTAQPAHDHGDSALNKRGEDARGMGFSQSATVHHFYLTKNGGIIQVEVVNPEDSATLQTVRSHLTSIAASFSKGDFTIPAFVHAGKPAGVDAMQQAKSSIKYTFVETARGGRVVITAQAKARSAVHDFLQFQIREHATGDSLEVLPSLTPCESPTYAR